jgi:hypothetical protein
MDLTLELQGLEQALARLEELEEDVETLSTYTVGTGVEYAVYLEFGTSKMDAKPFVRPTINEVRIQGVDGFIAHNTKTTVDAQESLNDVIRILAFAMERRMKEIITQKGLIETGTLRASIVAVRGGDPSALPSSDDLSGFDSSNRAPAGAGRAVAREPIQL